MTEWIKDSEEGESVRAKLNSIPNDGHLYNGPQALVAPTINITGDWFIEPAIVLAPAQTVVINGDAVAAAGAWIGDFSYDENGKPSSITAMSFPDLVGCFGSGAGFQLGSMPLLTSLDFGALEMSWGFDLDTMPELATLNLESLVYCNGQITFNSLGLTALSVPLLTFVTGSFDCVANTALTSISAPSLKTLYKDSLDIENDPALASVDFSSVEDVGGFVYFLDTALVTIGLPALRKVKSYIKAEQSPNLTTINLSALETIVGNGSDAALSAADATAALHTITLTSALRRVGGDVILTSCALTQSVVDNILVRLAALNGTSGTTAYSGNTVTITGTSAAPSVTGLAAKATLVGRGNTVTTN